MQAEKEYVRKNILAAATPLFYAKGYVKVPMRKIAEASHVGCLLYTSDAADE